MSLDQYNNKQLLEELEKRLNKSPDLEEEIKYLRQSLADVNERLTESEALKSHFISNIANEIVNPFTSVIALAENILEVDKENWKKVISMVSLIHSEVFNLDFQLKNIFAAAKIEAGEIIPDITLVDVNSLLNNLIKVFKYEARRKNLKIELSLENKIADSPIYFKTDSEKLWLITANLLSNAIKFSYNDNKVTITSIRNEKVLKIIVTDFGQGISQANEKIIFDRFKQIDSGINSLNRGHGLGLSVNKAFLDLLGGKISHSSTLGKGTRFEVILPEAEAETSGISTDADEIFFKEQQF